MCREASRCCCSCCCFGISPLSSNCTVGRTVLITVLICRFVVEPALKVIFNLQRHFVLLFPSSLNCSQTLLWFWDFGSFDAVFYADQSKQNSALSRSQAEVSKEKEMKNNWQPALTQCRPVLLIHYKASALRAATFAHDTTQYLPDLQNRLVCPRLERVTLLQLLLPFDYDFLKFT